MPEYLSPGVYVEEVPPRLRAIEGVSTSTAGFVGEAQRGPVAGFRPFEPLPGFDLERNAAPVLVTSFADYQRLFGEPPADPARNGYLGHAVRAFFDNGGKRVYIARAARPVVPPETAPASRRIGQGAICRLTRNVPDHETTVFLDSLRTIDQRSALSFIRADGSIAAGPIAVTDYDTMAGSVDLAMAPGAMDAARVAVRPVNVFAAYRGGGDGQ